MEHQHKRFDEELADLRARVIEMGRLVAEQIEGALWCLSDHDTRGAHLMIDCDTGVNEMDHEIEERCFELLALHQPVAVDLRFITATMKISTELERLGDRAVKICEAVHDLGENDSVKLDAQIAQLGALVTGMISESLRAFTQLDSSLAEGCSTRTRNSLHSTVPHLPSLLLLHPGMPKRPFTAPRWLSFSGI